MVRTLLALIVLLPLWLYSQEENLVRDGLLRAQGTFSFGKFSDIEQNGLYIHGNLEYYVNEKISARGDLFYYLKPNNESILELNHQLFSGGSYHIPTNSNFNPYIGFQPGLSITELSAPVYILPVGVPPPTPRASVSPLISGVLGFNYYANDWFHLFADMRYVYGNHLSNIAPEVSLNEIRFSFGLGFNINTK